MSYQALFNGNSRFGISGGGGKLPTSGGIILDDAHVTFRQCETSTLRIEKKSHKDDYEEITAMFRHDFQELGRVGTLDDVLRGSDRLSILEVPWSWRERPIKEVRNTYRLAMRRGHSAVALLAEFSIATALSTPQRSF